MVQTASLFSQLLHEVPRNEFARLVNRHQGERHAKGFTCWAQFTAMLFCQLAHADSLREICNGLACCVGKLVHLGINRGPSKSNLSYANVHRPAAVFEDLFWTMTDRFRAQSQLGSRTHTFRFKNKLLSLDSTTISLCLSLFPWAKFRRAKGGVKAHVLLDHDDYLPAYVLISQAKMHDAKILALLRLNQPVLNADETGHRTNGAKRWLWTLDRPNLCVLVPSPPRVEPTSCGYLLGTAFAGVLGSDRTPSTSSSTSATCRSTATCNPMTSSS